IGKFMFYLPITLIITLIASLIIAFIINPVFAVTFMGEENHEEDSKRSLAERLRSIKFALIVLAGITFLSYLFGWTGFGNFMAVLTLVVIIYNLFLVDVVNKFQFNLIPRFKDAYAKVIEW